MAPRRCTRKQKKPAEMPPEMKFVKVLGKGSFGEVQLYKYPKDDGSMFYNAVKITRDVNGHDSLRTEFEILSQLRGSPRIIQCFGDSLLEGLSINGSRELKMLMEYAAEGSLDDFIRINQRLSDSIIKDFTRMILQGLVDIHCLGYVHCDLKPANLLLFPRYDKITLELSYDIKISDFGLSTKAVMQPDYSSIDSPLVGTLIYMSPESVCGSTIRKGRDLWSLGCIVLEMFTGESPWTRVDFPDLKTRLSNGDAPKIPASVPSDARQFVEKCFALKPEERGSASELLEHPFLTGERKKTEEVAAVAGGDREPLTVKQRPKTPTYITQKPLRLKIIPPKPPKRKNGE